MTTKSFVLYPKLGDNDFFKMDYYLKEHMDAVEAGWSKYGMTAFEVIQFPPSPDGTASPYCVGVSLTWESAEAAQKAMASEETKALIADAPNFTSVKAIVLFGSIERTYNK